MELRVSISMSTFSCSAPVEVVKGQLSFALLPEEVDQQRGVDGDVLVCPLQVSRSKEQEVKVGQGWSVPGERGSSVWQENSQRGAKTCRLRDGQRQHQQWQRRTNDPPDHRQKHQRDQSEEKKAQSASGGALSGCEGSGGGQGLDERTCLSHKHTHMSRDSYTL